MTRPPKLNDDRRVEKSFIFTQDARVVLSRALSQGGAVHGVQFVMREGSVQRGVCTSYHIFQEKGAGVRVVRVRAYV